MHVLEEQLSSNQFEKCPNCGLTQINQRKKALDFKTMIIRKRVAGRVILKALRRSQSKIGSKLVKCGRMSNY
jgi:hypothetical protein